MKCVRQERMKAHICRLSYRARFLLVFLFVFLLLLLLGLAAALAFFGVIGRGLDVAVELVGDLLHLLLVRIEVLVGRLPVVLRVIRLSFLAFGLNASEIGVWLRFVVRVTEVVLVRQLILADGNSDENHFSGRMQ